MLKRLLDIIIAGLLLVLTAPLIIIITLLVHHHLGRPIFFRQRRPGLNEKPFELIKFRTMHEMADEQGKLLDDSSRLNSFGQFLRATSLDELPELWNVVKGDMSLVGPRPLLTEYLDHYDENEARRHQVKPGITGWAQINGRNAITWDQKFVLDVWYVDNRSFWLDLKILIKTIPQVLFRKNITARGEATMPRFKKSTRED